MQDVQVVGSRSKSDSKDGELRGEKAWRGTVFGEMGKRGHDGLGRHSQRCQPTYAEPRNISGYRRSHNRRSSVHSNCCLATLLFHHLTALPVHRAAAGTFFMAHPTSSRTGQSGRNCDEQKEYRDKAGDTAHRDLYYRLAKSDQYDLKVCRKNQTLDEMEKFRYESLSTVYDRRSFMSANPPLRRR
jgi:hypothetical protein